MLTYWEFLNKFVSSIYKLSYLPQLSSQGDDETDFLTQRWQKIGVWTLEISDQMLLHLRWLLCPLPRACERILPNFVQIQYSFKSFGYIDTPHLSCEGNHKSFKHFASWSNCFWLSDHSSIQTWSYFRCLQPLNASGVMASSHPALPCDILKLHRGIPVTQNTEGLSPANTGFNIAFNVCLPRYRPQL